MTLRWAGRGSGRLPAQLQRLAVLEVKLEPNQFQQARLPPASLGLGEIYTARISVRAVGGEGRALAYAP